MGFLMEWRNNDVIVVFDGTLKAQDIIDANSKLYGDERFDMMNYQIYDYRFVNKIEVKESDVPVIAILDKSSSKWNSKMKIANITSDPFSIRMVKVYAEMLEGTGWETKVFANMEEAIAWCSI